MFSERSERQKGFTLLETVVALATVGILTAAFTATASTIRTSQLTAIVRQVNSIREASDKYIEATGAINYTSVNMTTLINASYLPSSISSASSNPLGVTYATAAGSTNTQLVITISNLPDWARTSVANRLGYSGSASVLIDGTVQVVF